MSSPVSESCHWSRRRWGTLIALVFAAHLGLIFAFGDRKPVKPRPPASAPAFRLVPTEDELLALNDPTLLALPHRWSFAGATWLPSPVVNVRSFRWTEPPRLLELPTTELGHAFRQFMQTNLPAVFQLAIKIAPEVTATPRLVQAITGRSSLRVKGDLANRRLLNPPELPAQPGTDLLTNSVAQVLVRTDGAVISATLLAGSGSPDADQLALNFARAARFEPGRGDAARLALGTLIFVWHTVPMTNGPASAP